MRKIDDDYEVEYDHSGPFEEQLVRRPDDKSSFKRLIIGDFALSIQASMYHYCKPRKRLDDPTQYSEFEIALMEGEGKDEQWIKADDHRLKGLSIMDRWEAGDFPVRPYATIPEIDALIRRLEAITNQQEKERESKQ